MCVYLLLLVKFGFKLSSIWAVVVTFQNTLNHIGVIIPLRKCDF